MATRYHIAFNYLPEKKGDLLNELSKLGLKLEKDHRDIDLLVFK